MVDFATAPRDHGPMDMDDASPRARPDDPLMLIRRQDLDPLSVSELEERIAALTAEIERTRMKMQSAVNHRASADALFKK